MRIATDPQPTFIKSVQTATAPKTLLGHRCYRNQGSAPEPRSRLKSALFERAMHQYRGTLSLVVVKRQSVCLMVGLSNRKTRLRDADNGRSVPGPQDRPRLRRADMKKAGAIRPELLI